MSRVKRFFVRAGIGLAIVVPVAGVLGVRWYRSAYSMPPEARKPVQLPSPNGYDTLQAARSLVREPSRSFISKSMGARPPLPLAQRKELLAGNVPLYARIQEALDQEFLCPPVLSVKDSADQFPRFANFRELARLLSFAARTHADAGELPEAAGFALDGIQIGVAVPRGGALIPGLVGVACEAIGQKALWEVADRLDAPTARAAAQRLAGMQPRRWTFGETIVREGDYLSDINRMAFAAGPGRATWEALGEITNPASDEEDAPPPTVKERAAALWDQTKLIYYGPRTVQRNIDDWLAAVAERSKQPWGARTPLPPTPDDAFSRSMLPTFAQAEFKWVSIQAYAALLETYLALRAHRLDHGAYPTSLNELAHVPTDPFSPTRAPLGYRRNADGTMTLWSVGPDARDDGGRAAEVKDSDGTLRRGYVNSDSVGDIVARVNSY